MTYFLRVTYPEGRVSKAYKLQFLLFFFFFFMNTSFKKIMAGVTAVTVVAMNMALTTVNAAALNDVTASSAAGVITLDSAGTAFTGTPKVVVNGTVRTAVLNAGNIEITDADATADATLDAGNYSISFISDQTTATDSTDDVYGAVVYNTLAAGAANSNKVTVTASVLPILSMAIANTVIDLGNLTPAAINDSATDTTLTVATNATNGYIVSASATNFTDGTHTIPFRTRAAQAAGTSGFSIDVDSVTQAAGTSTVGATAGLAGASTFAVANGSASFAGASAGLGASVAGTTTGDIINVNYAGAVSTLQEAGNYSTTVTYTVTGAF